MAFISNDEINNIRARANIVDIVSSYIPLTQRGRNYIGVCPFHDDHSPSMSVSLEKHKKVELILIWVVLLLMKLHNIKRNIKLWNLLISSIKII